MLWLILVILLILLLIGTVPAWPYSSGWGYSPAGLVAAIVVVILLLWLFGVIEFRETSAAGLGVGSALTLGDS
jgi:hypothetical protein